MRRMGWIGIAGLVISALAQWAGAAMIPGGETIAGGQPIAGYSDQTYGNASNIVDGQVGTEWKPNGGSGYVTVDLGRNCRLSDVNLLNSVGFSDRMTSNFTVRVSTNGAFAGEQGQPGSGILQIKASGWQDVPLPTFSDPGNNATIVGRYVRFTAVDYYSGPGKYGPGLAEMTVKGIADRGTGALSGQGVAFGSVDAEAYTRTVWLTDTAPSSYTLRLITPTSASIVQSLGKSVTATQIGFSRNPANIVNGINDPTGSEFLFDGSAFADLSLGTATIDLGQEMLIDRIDLRNTYNYNDRGTTNYVLRVSNDSSFAEGNNTDVIQDSFSALDQAKSHVLGQAVLGRYVRFVAGNQIGFSAGLDEMTVYARTITSTNLATGTAQIGNSATWGRIQLGVPLAPGTNYLMALTVSAPGGWSSTALQTVTLVPPHGTMIMLH